MRVILHFDADGVTYFWGNKQAIGVDFVSNYMTSVNCLWTADVSKAMIYKDCETIISFLFSSGEFRTSNHPDGRLTVLGLAFSLCTPETEKIDFRITEKPDQTYVSEITLCRRR